MSRAMKTLTTVALVGLLGGVWAVEAQEPARISMDVTDAEVHTLLSTIAKQAGFNISVSDKVRGTVTVALRSVTPEQALEVVSKAVGARVRLDGEIYVIDPQPLPPERKAAVPPGPPTFPTVAPPTQPRAGAASGNPPTQAGTQVAEPQVVRLIPLKYIDPALVAQMFGGSAVGGGMGMMGSPMHNLRRGGGGGGYGGYGGYGGSGGYGGYGGRGGYQPYGGRGSYGGYGYGTGGGTYGGGGFGRGGGYGSRVGTFGGGYGY